MCVCICTLGEENERARERERARARGHHILKHFHPPSSPPPANKHGEAGSVPRQAFNGVGAGVLGGSTPMPFFLSLSPVRISRMMSSITDVVPATICNSSSSWPLNSCPKCASTSNAPITYACRPNKLASNRAVRRDIEARTRTARYLQSRSILILYIYIVYIYILHLQIWTDLPRCLLCDRRRSW